MTTKETVEKVLSEKPETRSNIKSNPSAIGWMN